MRVDLRRARLGSLVTLTDNVKEKWDCYRPVGQLKSR